MRRVEKREEEEKRREKRRDKRREEKRREEKRREEKRREVRQFSGKVGKTDMYGLEERVKPAAMNRHPLPRTFKFSRKMPLHCICVHAT
jgi:hypothetical protein